ncbi:MAG: HEPN domain-containing protein [Pseudomonadota bacterium]
MKSSHDLANLLLRKAGQDRAAAEKLTTLGGPFGPACFHMQQAAEKYLKALLAHRGVEYPHTHDLGVLLDMCCRIAGDLERLRDEIVTLQPYSVQMRYDDIAEPEAREARAGLGVVTVVREAVVRLMPPGTADRT